MAAKDIQSAILCHGKPSDKKCPKCGGYMIEKGSKLVCADETCGYVESKNDKEQ